MAFDNYPNSLPENMRDEFPFNFPPMFLDDFLEACDYYEIPKELTESVLYTIDYPLFDTYFVNPDLVGDERMREFVAEAFNELNRDQQLGYDEIPMSEHTSFHDDAYYIPPGFDTDTYWQER